MPWDSNATRTAKRLAEEMAGAGAHTIATIQAYGATARSLAQSMDELFKRLDVLELAEKTVQLRIEEERRHAERIADAAKLYLRLQDEGDPEKAASALAPLQALLATVGVPDAVGSRGRAIEYLAALADPKRWDNVVMVTKGEGRTLSMWHAEGASDSERHPRDIARLALRELLGLDVDDPAVQRSYLSAYYSGSDDADDEDEGA